MNALESVRRNVFLMPLLPAAACSFSTPTTIGSTQVSFSDCAECPEMIVIPSGTFLIGSDTSEPGHIEDESPQVEVNISRFAASKFEVTLGQF